jgi:type VI secretion system secreted protein VgrG
MPTYTQTQRPIAITTPLGKDVLLLTGFRGQEAISQLFSFQVDLLSEAKNKIRFDHIVGQNVTVEMRLGNEEKRYFNGVVKRFSQGARDATFVHFRAEFVPKLWLLTKKIRSRIFQHLSVPEILRQVFSELDVAYEISGTYYQRDYCVQYRESDFDFASRLMEEEGIYYFFKHAEASHQMVVTDAPNQHPSVSGPSKVIYDEVSGGVRKDMRITAWEKTQELRSGEYSLWDHCFELPDKHLEAKRKTIDSVTVGEVTHKLSVGGNDQLKIYDYPGGYAQRFSGVDRNGAARPQDLQNIFPDSERTVRVRLEQEEVASLEIRGVSNCVHFCAGYTFKLERHFDADGLYLLTGVDHDARLEGNYRSNQALAFLYENRFTCIPVALPYRPQRVTRKPVIAGAQTATVVGPRGEEIFCDKYGRVKVQFHWDREGKKNADSSCWVRTTGVWAGRRRGTTHIPLVGDEVVVGFLEGDPDRPIIVGSVYNAAMMPPLDLPANKTKSVIRDHGINEMIMEEKAGEEFIQLKQAYGNEIKMDAKAKTIRLYCPTHNTELVMGKSISWTTDSDHILVIFGNEMKNTSKNTKEVLLGWKHSTVGGFRTEITVGTKSELNILNKNTVVIGLNSQIIKGKDWRWPKAGRNEKIPTLQQVVNSRREKVKEYSQKIDSKKEWIKYLESQSDKVNFVSKQVIKMKTALCKREIKNLKAEGQEALWKYGQAKFVCDMMKLC